MRIIFVRHGHPDYAHDCLTPLGHQHAAAAAARLTDEGITQIFSSTCGRAMETAAYLSRAIGRPVVPCDFLREVAWGSADGTPMPAGGHPWSIAQMTVARSEPLLDGNWQQHEGFAGSKLLGCMDTVAAGADNWLSSLGYTREGLYYRAGQDTRRTVAVFGHSGAGSALISHLFNLPMPFICHAMRPDYTAITIIRLPDRPGELLSPKFELLNDARHIRGLETENIFGN